MAKVKRVAGLDCSATAEKIIPLVLGAQLKAMCALRDKALNWKDPEGVHDMRVLSRHLRSAIGDFRPYLRKSTPHRGKLVAIAKSLGAVRDEDVALLALEDLKSKALGEADGIEMLAEERRRRRKRARAALKEAIKPATVAEFRKEFLADLRAIAIAPPKKSENGQADDTAIAFKGLGAEIIRDRLKDLRSASLHIYHPFENKELHELRIMAKRLRYAIDLFAPCWGEEIEDIAKEISLLQTSLGELHDCDVWIESLGSRLKEIVRKDKTDETTIRLREGAIWLLKHFVRERMEHYREALSRWQQWGLKGFLEHLESILEDVDHNANASEVHH